MKRLYVEMYDRALTKAFAETGTDPEVIAHYERLDGRGGFLIEELPEDGEKSYER